MRWQSYLTQTFHKRVDSFKTWTLLFLLCSLLIFLICKALYPRRKTHLLQSFTLTVLPLSLLSAKFQFSKLNFSKTLRTEIFLHRFSLIKSFRDSGIWSATTDANFIAAAYFLLALTRSECKLTKVGHNCSKCAKRKNQNKSKYRVFCW